MARCPRELVAVTVRFTSAAVAPAGTAPPNVASIVRVCPALSRPFVPVSGRAPGRES